MMKIEFILLVRALIGLEKDTLMAASSFSEKEVKEIKRVSWLAEDAAIDVLDNSFSGITRP